MTAREPDPPKVPKCPHCATSDGVRRFEPGVASPLMAKFGWEHASDAGGCGRLFVGSAVEFQNVQASLAAEAAARGDIEYARERARWARGDGTAS